LIKKIISVINTQGIKGLVGIVLSRIYIKKSKHYVIIKKIVSQGLGLEIGGMSSVFYEKNLLPIYPHIKYLDNCNFSHKTVWENDKNSTFDPRYHKEYILEATDLKDIKSDSYDFLLSSHMIEHTANPIKALKEWIRVVKPNGHLIVLITHKNGKFEHRRPIKSLEKMIKEYERDVDENDFKHLDEILELHDRSMDLEAGTLTEFSERSRHNYENRCLHHHVFNTYLVADLFDYLELNIVGIEAIAPLHILIVAQKLQKDIIPDNRELLNHLHSYKWKTPFASDQR